tara:strand:- start:1146 stop:1382 length:237 start_codon:yes stop_codon:yes gene_type:complete
MNIDKLKIPNNKFKNCPAIMSDGRLVTDYRPNVKMNTFLNNKNNIGKDNYKYRQFLIHNAENIMNSQSIVLQRINNCL